MDLTVFQPQRQPGAGRFHSPQSDAGDADPIVLLKVGEGGFIVRAGYIFNLSQTRRARGHARRLIQRVVKQSLNKKHICDYNNS